MMKKEVKKNIPTSLNGGEQIPNDQSVSETPSTSKIKQDNVQKLDFAKSNLLKQGMVKDLSQNPSLIYKEHYINKLASLGYDKQALLQFANTISKKQQDPSTVDVLEDDGSGILKYVPEKDDTHPILKSIIKGGEFLNEQAVNSEQSIEKGVKQASDVLPNLTSYIKSNPNASMKDILIQSAKEEVKGIAGIGKAGFGALGVVSPELIVFNTATQAANNLPDVVKSGAVKAVLPSQFGKTDKENAEIFDRTVQLPFSVVSTIAHLAGHNPQEGSFEKSLYEIGDLITPLVAHGTIKTFKDFKDTGEKIAKGTADAPELQDYLEVSKSLGNITPDEVVTEAKKQGKEALVGNLSAITKPQPIEHDELHNKLAELQQKTADPEFQKLPIEVQSGIMRDIEDTQNEISVKTQDQLNSELQQAHSDGEIKELDNKIDQVEAAMDGQPTAVKESIQETLNSLKAEKQDAVQKSSTSSLLQHAQESVGETGGERTGVESSQQGNESTEESKTEIGIQETPEEQIVDEKLPELTKITHAAIETDRAKLGLPPIEKEPSDIQGDFKEAQQTFRDNPRLAQEAIESGKPVSRKDVYKLALQKMDLKSQAKAIREQILQSPEHADELKTKLRLVEEHMDVNDQALKNVSSEAGKALQAMQAALAEDMSLENTLLTARSYSKTGKITVEQAKTLTEITSRLEEAEKKLADYEEAKNKTGAQNVVDDLAIQEKIKSGVESEIEKINKKLPSERRIKADKAIAALEKFQKEIRSNNYSSVPVAILDTAITTIKLAIKAGINIADAVELGIDKVKELHGKWDKEDLFRKDMLAGFEENKIDIKERKAVKLTEEGKIKNLRSALRGLVEKGIIDIDSIVKELHKELPEMTEREIRDEISGYGKTSELSTEPIDKKIREVKRIGGLISALEDVQKGESPKRTGLKRDELTEEEKKLRSQINEGMRENQIEIEKGEMTPEQWKTTLDKYKKRLANKYNELLDQKKNNDYEVKKKHILELDAEALELKKKIEKEKGNRKRELEKIRLENRGKFEKYADNIIKLMRFGILASAHKAILKLGIAGAAKGYLQNPVNTIIAGGWSKVPGIREVYNQSPRWRSKGATKALAHGIAEAWSTKTKNDIKSQAAPILNPIIKKLSFGKVPEFIKSDSGGKRADEIMYGTDKGHLPPGLSELWNVEHKILKTPLMNAEFRTSMEKNLQFLADQGKNIADPTVQAIASARATEDAARAVYMSKNSLVTGYHAMLRSLAAKTKDGSTGGEVIGKILEGENLIVKVPSNFIQEQLESTPIGALQFINGIRKGINDLPPEVADRLARKLNNATAGTIALTVGGLLYLNHFGGNKYIRQGNNRAAKEEDNMSEEEMNLMNLNIPPYMQHFNFAQQLQMGAGIARIMDYYNEIDKKHHVESENHFTKAAWEAMGSTASKIPFAESAVKLTEAMKGADAMKKLMGSFIDNVLALPGYVAKATDSEEKRVANNPLEQIKSNIPGLRETLPSKADLDSKARLAKLFKKFRSDH